MATACFLYVNDRVRSVYGEREGAGERQVKELDRGVRELDRGVRVRNRGELDREGRGSEEKGER